MTLPTDSRDRFGFRERRHEVLRVERGIYDCSACAFIGTLTKAIAHTVANQPNLVPPKFAPITSRPA